MDDRKRFENYSLVMVGWIAFLLGSFAIMRHYQVGFVYLVCIGCGGNFISGYLFGRKDEIYHNVRK